MRPLPLILAAAAGSIAAPAVAADLTVTVDLPTIRTAAYHRPYVGIWIEQPGTEVNLRNIALWYEAGATARGDGDGEQYLKDLSLWWRRGGRATTLPISGVTGPTRAAGRHTVTVPGARLASLPAGTYNLVVEVAREQGGRERIRVPITWGRAGNATGTGTTEIGAIRVAITR